MAHLCEILLQTVEMGTDTCDMLKAAVGNETGSCSLVFKLCQQIKSCEEFWEVDIVQGAHLHHW
jgi:hypothetical protein